AEIVTNIDERECGFPAIDPLQISKLSRIVGGSVVKPHSWPWQVGLCYSSNIAEDVFCGGTLISETWIVTAAHCIDFLTESELLRVIIVVGAHDMTASVVDEDERQLINVQRVIYHPRYDIGYELNYDIALIELNTSAVLGENVAVACLPITSLTNGQQSYVTGWGSTASGGGKVTRLREVMVPIIDRTHCIAESNYTANDDLSITMVCAGSIVGGIDTCQGDSGGPLVTQMSHNSSLWQLSGVISWGIGCGDPSYPGVYTDVILFNNWIKGIISNHCGDSSCCAYLGSIGECETNPNLMFDSCLEECITEPPVTDSATTESITSTIVTTQTSSNIVSDVTKTSQTTTDATLSSTSNGEDKNTGQTTSTSEEANATSTEQATSTSISTQNIVSLPPGYLDLGLFGQSRGKTLRTNLTRVLTMTVLSLAIVV
ncbi:unnamed protein product, partial [Owenia fusiformis]